MIIKKLPSKRHSNFYLGKKRYKMDWEFLQRLNEFHRKKEVEMFSQTHPWLCKFLSDTSENKP